MLELVSSLEMMEVYGRLQEGSVQVLCHFIVRSVSQKRGRVAGTEAPQMTGANHWVLDSRG